MSAAAIRLRDRLIELRDEQDTASPEFARLDWVATLLESARVAVVDAAGELEATDARDDRADAVMVALLSARDALARRILEARAELLARH